MTNRITCIFLFSHFTFKFDQEKIQFLLLLEEHSKRSKRSTCYAFKVQFLAEKPQVPAEMVGFGPGRQIDAISFLGRGDCFGFLCGD